MEVVHAEAVRKHEEMNKMLLTHRLSGVPNRPVPPPLSALRP